MREEYTKSIRDKLDKRLLRSKVAKILRTQSSALCLSKQNKEDRVNEARKKALGFSKPRGLGLGTPTEKQRFAIRNP